MSDAREPGDESPPRKRSARDIFDITANSLAENRDAEGIREATQKLVEELQAAGRESGVLPGEPMMPLLEALTRAVGWMGEMSAEFAKMSAQVPAILTSTRKAADAERERERAAAAADRVSFIREVAQEIAASTRETQQQTARTYERNSWLASVVGVVAISGILGGASYLFGRQQGASAAYTTDENIRAILTANPTRAPAWLNLMKSNDPIQTFAGCHGAAVHVYDGRRACEVPVWLDPPNIFKKPAA